MKHVIIAMLFVTAVAACNKDRNNVYIEEELRIFLSYEKFESAKFLDTFNYTHTLKQLDYQLEFKRPPSANPYGLSIKKYERYLADYGFHELNFSVRVQAPNSFDIVMYGYRIGLGAIIPPPLASVTVNGKTYTNVYPFVALNYISNTVPPAQAIMYWNKEYGLIQLLFPSGKAIVRLD